MKSRQAVHTSSPGANFEQVGRASPTLSCVLDLLASRQSPRLIQLLACRPLLAFDFDGTLAPIAATPRAVRLPETTRDLLRRVARERPCAVISGRGRSDLQRRLARIPLALVVGSHGAEWPGETLPASWPKALRSWRLALETALGPLPGVVFEPKPAALSVHYRLAPDRVRARAAILEATLGLSARVEPGLLVVNLFPTEAPDKGAALRRAMAELGCETALYFGDDRGDEAAFGAGVGVVGVLVGHQRRSQAKYRLAAQSRMDGLLARVLATTPPSSKRVPPRRSGG